MAAQLCDYAKNHSLVCLTWAKRMVYELHGNEALIKIEGREREETTIKFLE